MSDVKEIVSSIEDLTKLFSDATLLYKHHAMDMEALLDVITRLQALVKEVPLALPEIMHIDGPGAAAVGSASYDLVKQILLALKP